MKKQTSSRITPRLTRKKLRRSPRVPQTKNAKLIYKPETLLGGVLILCLICVAPFIQSFVSFHANQLKDMTITALTTPPATSAPVSTSVLTGIISDASIFSPAVSASNSAALTATASMAPATATQATPSAIQVRVKKDQTFWEFSKRYCGTHTLAEKLARDNGYNSVSELKEGDWITVSCQ